MGRAGCGKIIVAGQAFTDLNVLDKPSLSGSSGLFRPTKKPDKRDEPNKPNNSLLPLALTLPVIRPHVKMPPRRIGAERCESGRIDMLGKHASQQWDRGFESHPLRHIQDVKRET